MTRVFDFIFSFLGLLVLSPIMVVLMIIGWMDTGSPFFFQERVGRGAKPFLLVKFRSMRRDTQSVATHLVNANMITRWGRILRRTKMDELPQLWNVLVGDMSFVGPRPNLYNQTELIREREEKDVYRVRPGITGLAQVNKIDMSTPALLAKTDEKMILNFSLLDYFRLIFRTLFGAGFGDRVRG